MSNTKKGIINYGDVPPKDARIGCDPRTLVQHERDLRRQHPGVFGSLAAYDKAYRRRLQAREKGRERRETAVCRMCCGALVIACLVLLVVGCSAGPSQLGIDAAKQAVAYGYPGVEVADLNPETRLASLDTYQPGRDGYPTWLGTDWSAWVTAVHLWEVEGVVWCEVPSDPTVGDVAGCLRMPPNGR